MISPLRRALFVALFAPASMFAQADTTAPIIGRWDLHVQGKSGGIYPSWLEVERSGNSVLVGRFVGRVGSARPISHVEWSNGAFKFAIPPQWQRESADLVLNGKLAGDKLTGTITNPDGTTDSFTGVRAPRMMRAAAPTWGTEISLFDGKTLGGWEVQPGSGANKWQAQNGMLTNTGGGGGNLRTTRTFTDFKLHLEVRFVKGSNSGIYLRGRHEVQVEDSPHNEWPGVHDVGAVYGFLPPSEIAALPAGQWNTYDITLVGRMVTVVLNGKTVISNQLIPGITGGAQDSDEGEPGPILLQGDHTAVEYRNIRLTPAR